MLLPLQLNNLLEPAGGDTNLVIQDATHAHSAEIETRKASLNVFIESLLIAPARS